jgi:hypothetical protein
MFDVYDDTKLIYFLYVRACEYGTAYKTVAFLKVETHGTQFHKIVFYLFAEWRVNKGADITTLAAGSKL